MAWDLFVVINKFTPITEIMNLLLTLIETFYCYCSNAVKKLATLQLIFCYLNSITTVHVSNISAVLIWRISYSLSISQKGHQNKTFDIFKIDVYLTVKRQFLKMVKHTQTIRQQIDDELFECVWPFCGIGA